MPPEAWLHVSRITGQQNSGAQGWIRTTERRKGGQIYSLLALTAHPPVRFCIKSFAAAAQASPVAVFLKGTRAKATQRLKSSIAQGFNDAQRDDSPLTNLDRNPDETYPGRCMPISIHSLEIATPFTIMPIRRYPRESSTCRIHPASAFERAR